MCSDTLVCGSTDDMFYIVVLLCVIKLSYLFFVFFAVFTVSGLSEWQTIINLSAQLLGERVTCCRPRPSSDGCH